MNRGSGGSLLQPIRLWRTDVNTTPAKDADERAVRPQSFPVSRLLCDVTKRVTFKGRVEKHTQKNTQTRPHARFDEHARKHVDNLCGSLTVRAETISLFFLINETASEVFITQPPKEPAKLRLLKGGQPSSR